MKDIHNSNKSPDFSLVLGGPFFQLLMHLGLINPALGLLKKRIIFFILITWMPLLLLSLIQGTGWKNAGLPFLYDIETQTRFLIALPLLIAAELLAHSQVRLLIGQFIDREIVTGKVTEEFYKIIASAVNLRNSMIVEVVLFLLVFVAGHYLSNTVSAIETIASKTGAWYASADSTGANISPAGYWYVFISRPLFQFITCRWYFRIFVWARFLLQTSRLKLNLIPTHPDRACGLGFLSMSTFLFAPLILAHGVMFAGLIANSIFFAGAQLIHYIILILALILFVLMFVMGPLAAFLPALMGAKRTGLRDYGVLASWYVEEFDLKWIRGGVRDEKLMGSGDIQSLADLANSFQVIRDIRSVPFDKEAIFQVIFLVTVPILPLILTMVPLEELIKKFIQAIF